MVRRGRTLRRMIDGGIRYFAAGAGCVKDGVGNGAVTGRSRGGIASSSPIGKSCGLVSTVRFASKISPLRSAEPQVALGQCRQRVAVDDLVCRRLGRPGRFRQHQAHRNTPSRRGLRAVIRT